MDSQADDLAVDESLNTGSALLRGRRAYEQRAWREAYELLTAADRETSLDAPDLERLAFAAHLIGNDEEAEDLLARAHQDCLQRDEIERAARCAFWTAFSLFNRREQARASGWIARAQRLLDDCGRDCVERGYLLLPVAIQTVFAGNLTRAHELFTEMAAIADRFHDPDLSALARMGQGRSLVKLGEIQRGVALLDEAMAGIEAGAVSPIVAGDVYCSLIEACTEIFDVRRAHEWTASLTHWCETQPELVLFRGQCLIRRAELLRLRGAWPEAMSEVQQACARLSEPPPPQRAVGLALYQQAELHRLRGEFEAAESAYREASKYARKPRPGLALLRLAQGNVDAAAAAIRALVAEADEPDTRSQVLAAQVDIELAANDLEAARAAADELSSIADKLDAALLYAMAAHAQGAVLLAEGESRRALAQLQRAWSGWQDLDAPYEAARARVLLGHACRRLGDDDTATVEFDAARWTFERLGAAPDLDALRAATPRATDTSGLTARELDVLRLVAQGKTNKAIAAELFISERTVHRHVANIFRKLGLSTRAAATAYAFQQHLV